jgi:hypothetical protein
VRERHAAIRCLRCFDILRLVAHRALLAQIGDDVVDQRCARGLAGQRQRGEFGRRVDQLFVILAERGFQRFDGYLERFEPRGLFRGGRGLGLLGGQLRVEFFLVHLGILE